jgi:hypothetical protein
MDVSMPQRTADVRAIELAVHDVGQLFHTLDPMPFRERDLDSAVEQYVVGWAQELKRSHPIEIVVHLPEAEAAKAQAQHIDDAIRNYFAYRATVIGWELRELFRAGRVSLAVGLMVLAACVVLGKMLGRLFGASYLAQFFEEGLIILGWVANWRPIQIFLYDWEPLVRHRGLYRRLSRAVVIMSPRT